MKKEELFETLSDLDPAMVKKARDYQRSRRGCMEKMDGRGSLRGDHRRSCAGGYDMEKWTGEFGSPLPVGAKDGYGSLSGICGADDGCTGIYGK